MDEKQRKGNPSPILKANFVSRAVFWWLNPLFREGYKRSLETADLTDVLPQDSTYELTTRLEREWEKEILKKKDGKKPSLWAAIARTFGPRYALCGVLVFFEESLKLTQAIFLGMVVQFFSPQSDMSIREAYLYAGAVSLCAFAINMCHHPYFFNAQRTGMWLRISCCSLLFKKSLKLTSASLGKTTVGHVVNLMSNDVNRFDQVVLFVHFLWVGPTMAIVLLAVLWYMLGAFCLAGYAALLLLIPLQMKFGKLFGKLRRKTAVETDERVRTMHEVLNGIRVIKMYCWEKMFGEKIYAVREREMKRVQAGAYTRAAITAPFFSSAKIIAYLTFLPYVLLNRSLTARTVFMVIALYNPVRLVMNLFMPTAIQFLFETKVTLQRLQDFLLLEEQESSSMSKTDKDKRPAPEDVKLTALNVAAAWEDQSSVFEDVNFEVRPGELLAIVGPVGVGKSSLLLTLLGELPLKSGSLKINGQLAYVCQQPWVFSASIRQNILFGKEFNHDSYQQAIRAAALTKDLGMLPDGDSTLVGERGASLSGGQKARITFARAMYADADIYLLDDPLSAVDAAVGRHLFDKCICGVLKKKPRILVTHQLQYLTSADKILVMKEGKTDGKGAVVGMGTYDELTGSGVDFAALLEEEKKDDSQNNGYSVPSSPVEETQIIFATADKKKKNNLLNNDYLSKSFDRGYLKDNKQDSLQRQILMPSKSLTHIGGSLKKRNVHHSVSDMSLGNQKKLSDSVMSIPELDIMPDFVAPVPMEEKRASGNIGFCSYMRYFRTGAGIPMLLLILLLNLLAQVTYLMCDWWLSYWSVCEENHQVKIREHESLLAQGFNQTNITIPYIDRNLNLGIYTSVVVSVFVFALVRALLSFRMLVRASGGLHNKMFNSIIRSPTLFFDTNQSGRILNRFSRDIGLMDEMLPMTMNDVFQCGLLVLGLVLLTGIVNPWVFIPTFPIAAFFIYLRHYYLNTSRDVKRLEGTTRSPVFTHLSATLQGLTTIRAYQCQDKFVEEFARHQDEHTSAWFLFLTTNRWFALRLDLLCSCFITGVSFSSVIASSSLDGGLVGLVMTSAIGLSGLFQWAVRQSAEAENQMTSVERVTEYAELPPEAALESSDKNRPSPDWPQNGSIVVKDACYRYAPHGPMVLKYLNFTINPREKIGVVGRTGAGKSSLITMLFRMSEPEGSIEIDGVDITSIGLHELRNKISIIPQDPVLFNATMRKNLDPFDQYADNSIWDALEQVQLKKTIAEWTNGLSSQITEGGQNLSVGQRQLVCLARAIVRSNRILVIDEATANVDPETDKLIQETIRDKFRACTVITIAHRLHTIMDSDRIMVLSEGKLIEFDQPRHLLQNTSSLLYTMVQHTGENEASHLLDIAEKSATNFTKPNGHIVHEKDK